IGRCRLIRAQRRQTAHRALPDPGAAVAIQARRPHPDPPAASILPRQAMFLPVAAALPATPRLPVGAVAVVAPMAAEAAVEVRTTRFETTLLHGPLRTPEWPVLSPKAARARPLPRWR